MKKHPRHVKRVFAQRRATYWPVVPSESETQITDAFLVGLAYDRIGQLNRQLFAHRVFFATVVASVFAVLQYLHGFLGGLGSEYLLDWAVLLLVSLLAFGAVVSCVIAFLDFIHLDLLEDCVSVIRNIERKNNRNGSEAIYNKAVKGITAVKLNMIVAMFYCLPIFFMQVAVWRISDEVLRLPGDYSDTVLRLASQYCRGVAAEASGSVVAIPNLFAACAPGAESFDFSSGAKSLVFTLFLVSSMMSGILFVNMVSRIGRRVFLIWTIGPLLDEVYSPWVVLTRFYSALSRALQVAAIMTSLIVFAGVLMFSEFRQYLIELLFF